MYTEKEKIPPGYVLKNHSNRKKQVILLMTLNGKGWHYAAVKQISALLIGISTKHYGDFHCLNCPHSFRTKGKLESHKKVFENKDFCQLCLLKTLKY